MARRERWVRGWKPWLQADADGGKVLFNCLDKTACLRRISRLVFSLLILCREAFVRPRAALGLNPSAEENM